MQYLSQQAFASARRYVKERARPLDRALFEYRFEGGPAERVAAELAVFQNADGGFGRALEPDTRTPSSTAIATGIALHTLKEIGAPATSSLVAGAVSYLQNTYDSHAHVWRPVAPDTNAYPHAPWWHDESGSLARTFGDFLIIPRAEIVAMLYHWRSLVPVGWLDDLAQRTIADIEAEPELGTGGGSDFEYGLDLLAASELPGRLSPRLCLKLGTAVKAARYNPSSWDSYGATPLRFAPTPSSPFVSLIRNEVDRYLAYLIDHQAPDGAWEPNWSWGNFYPEAWEQARLEWRGRVTLEKLTALKLYDRISAR